MSANPCDVRFLGDWLPGERKVAAAAAAAACEFLNFAMPTPWVFVKGARGYSLTQRVLFRSEKTAAKLPDLLEEIRRAAADAGKEVRGGH